MELTVIWFIAIAVLWTGYFVLEGFDFGVGVLLPVLGRDDRTRRVMINTIGPVWDGNEVWLLTAGGATFAAFPEWYASLFSGFYLPLLIILVALIVRGVAFEYRAKRDEERWRRRWDRAIFWGSLVPAFMWGVAFGNIVRGVPLDERHLFDGTVLDLLNPYALLGGLVTLTLFVTHGAIFLALKTEGEIRSRARDIAAMLGIGAAVLAVAFLALIVDSLITGIMAAVAAAALIAAIGLVRAAREGWAFFASAVTIGLATITLFTVLFPAVLPSTIDPAFSLTVTNAAATPKTLGIMSVVALIFLPLVLVYQGWTYWVFRRRIGVQHIPASQQPTQ